MALSTATDHHPFAPPATPGLVRAVALALLAHALLMAALTWGVAWKREAQTVTVEAELWASVPLQAAPAEVMPPPEPPTPVPQPTPSPEPLPPAPLPRAQAAMSDANIALAREKERKDKARQEQDKLLKEKQALEKKRQQEKLAQERKLAEEKKKKELEAKLKETRDKQKALEEARQTEKQRQENLQRMAGLAGASGAATATGTASRASAPSASYAGRIVARVKPNIVYSENISNNPSAEVEVRTAPDGTITGRKLLKPSGVPAWDEAVLKAIDKTEVLPRDTDGHVPSTLVITFRPRD